MEWSTLAEHGAVEVIPNIVGHGADHDEARDWGPGAGGDDLAGAAVDPGRLLEGCRQYLLMIANEVIGSDLRAKVGASDLVQETFLEAQRHIIAFRGRTRNELRAWLRTILECRLANLRRAYLATEKRSIRREVAIESLMAAWGGEGQVLASRAPSPSDHVIRSELTEALDRALARLPEHYRRAIVGGTRSSYPGMRSADGCAARPMRHARCGAGPSCC